jgi:hypothetical protein
MSTTKCRPTSERRTVEVGDHGSEALRQVPNAAAQLQAREPKEEDARAYNAFSGERSCGNRITRFG